MYTLPYHASTIQLERCYSLKHTGGKRATRLLFSPVFIP